MGLLASAATDWIQAVGTSAGALLAGAAAVAAVGQLRAIRRQTTASTQANVSQAYAVVSQQMGEIRGLLLGNPEWYPYFYEGAEPPEDDPRLEIVCESFCDFADGLVEQRRLSHGADMDWSTWEAYFRYLYASSPLLRRYLVLNVEFYPDYVLSMFGFVVVRDERTGEVLSMWGARELGREAVRAAFGEAIPNPVVGGYPWIRTWELREVFHADAEDEAEPPDRDRRRLAASVQPPEDGAQTASLYLGWQGEEDAAATQVLQSWLLSLVGESTRLVAVDIFLIRAGRKEKLGRREIRPESQAAARERFLVPMVPIRR